MRCKETAEGNLELWRVKCQHEACSIPKDSSSDRGEGSRLSSPRQTSSKRVHKRVQNIRWRSCLVQGRAAWSAGESTSAPGNCEASWLRYSTKLWVLLLEWRHISHGQSIWGFHLLWGLHPAASFKCWTWEPSKGCAYRWQASLPSTVCNKTFADTAGT